MSAFMQVSTGTTCAMRLPSQSILLITPLPAPSISPTGPLRLSTHPGTGSFIEGHTAIFRSGFNNILIYI